MINIDMKTRIIDSILVSFIIVPFITIFILSSNIFNLKVDNSFIIILILISVISDIILISYHNINFKLLPYNNDIKKEINSFIPFVILFTLSLSALLMFVLLFLLISINNNMNQLLTSICSIICSMSFSGFLLVLIVCELFPIYSYYDYSIPSKYSFNIFDKNKLIIKILGKKYKSVKIKIDKDFINIFYTITNDVVNMIVEYNNTLLYDNNEKVYNVVNKYYLNNISAEKNYSLNFIEIINTNSINKIIKNKLLGAHSFQSKFDIRIIKKDKHYSFITIVVDCDNNVLYCTNIYKYLCNIYVYTVFINKVNKTLDSMFILNK